MPGPGDGRGLIRWAPERYSIVRMSQLRKHCCCNVGTTYVPAKQTCVKSKLGRRSLASLPPATARAAADLGGAVLLGSMRTNMS